jgi:excisionase family DNA binding protein
VEFLTPKEVAELLKISYIRALDFIKYSGIQYIKIGNQYRVTKANLEKFLNVKNNVIVKFE